MWNKDDQGNWYLNSVITSVSDGDSQWACDDQGNWFLEASLCKEKVFMPSF